MHLSGSAFCMVHIHTYIYIHVGTRMSEQGLGCPPRFGIGCGASFEFIVGHRVIGARMSEQSLGYPLVVGLLLLD